MKVLDLAQRIKLSFKGWKLNFHHKVIKQDNELVKIFWDQSSRWIKINWAMTAKCNYRCSYCHCNNNASQNHPPEEDIISFILKIKKHIKLTNIKVELILSGGEISLLSCFPEVVSLLDDKNIYVTFITNLSRPLAFWEKIYWGNNNKIVHCSFHIENTSMSDFEAKIGYLVTQNISIVVSIMMLPDRFDDLYNFALSLSKKYQGSYIFVDLLQEGFGTGNTLSFLPEYTDEQIERVTYFPVNEVSFFSGPSLKCQTESGAVLNLDAKRELNMQQNRYRGWYCNAGVDSFVICHECVWTSYCSSRKKLGSLKDFDIAKCCQNMPIRCKSYFCGCSFDIETPKATTKMLL